MAAIELSALNATALIMLTSWTTQLLLRRACSLPVLAEGVVRLTMHSLVDIQAAPDVVAASAHVRYATMQGRNGAIATAVKRTWRDTITGVPAAMTNREWEESAT